MKETARRSLSIFYTFLKVPLVRPDLRFIDHLMQGIIGNWKKRAVADTGETRSILDLARQLHLRGIKAKDALHIASSVDMQCEYFITTDLYIIKKLANFEKIMVVSPIDFINFIKQ